MLKKHVAFKQACKPGLCMQGGRVWQACFVTLVANAVTKLQLKHLAQTKTMSNAHNTKLFSMSELLQSLHSARGRNPVPYSEKR